MQSLISTFDNLSFRERGLVYLSVFALIFFFWNLSFMSGLEKKEKSFLTKQLSLEKQATTLDEQIKKLQDSSILAEKKDPALKNKIKLLQKEIVVLDQQKKSLTSGAVRPKKIIEVLKNVLVNIKGLKVVRMNVLDATPLDAEAVTDIKKYLYSKISTPYKHEIEIELHGNYSSIFKYLKKLESLDKVFYWNEITYKALAWPNAHIVLKVYTISFKMDDANA